MGIDQLQFGFMPGFETGNAIFILKLENYLVKKKSLFIAFVDLEKAFDRVPVDVA